MILIVQYTLTHLAWLAIHGQVSRLRSDKNDKLINEHISWMSMYHTLQYGALVNNTGRE